MSGFKGLGVSKKFVTSGGSAVEKIYELTAEDYASFQFEMREELFGHTIIFKETVVDGYGVAMLPITLGNDGDWVRFKLFHDVVDETYEPYFEIYGADWESDLDLSFLDHGNVGNDDGYFWMMGNHNEVLFVKKEGKWTVKRDKGLFNVGEWKTPKFYDLTIDHTIYSKSNLNFNVKGVQCGSINDGWITFQKPMRSIGNIQSITHNTQTGHPSLGTVDYPFGDLNLKGIVNAKTLNIEDGIPTTLENDLTPKLGGILDVQGNRINGIDQIYGADSIANYIKLGGTGLINIGGAGGWSLLTNNAVSLYCDTTNTNITVYTSRLVPSTSYTQDLGRVTKEWRTLYAKNAVFSDGATDTFTSNDGKTVTVTNGIITSIV